MSSSVEWLDEPVVVEALEEPGGGQGADVAHAVLDQGLRLGSLLWILEIRINIRTILERRLQNMRAF